MGVDGRQADMEAVGDLLAHQSADHEREHLHLARGEGGMRRVGLGRRQVATARVALLHKAQHLADERLLGHAHTEVAKASQLGVGVGGEGQHEGLAAAVHKPKVVGHGHGLGHEIVVAALTAPGKEGVEGGVNIHGHHRHHGLQELAQSYRGQHVGIDNGDMGAAWGHLSFLHRVQN